MTNTEIKAKLKEKGFKFSETDNTFYFSKCPVCNIERGKTGGAIIDKGSGEFYCLSCMESLSFEQLLSREWEKKKYTTTRDSPYKKGSVVSPFIFDPVALSDLSAEQENVEWIWDGWIAKGHLTLFSALWKSGKSTLIGQLLKAMENEGLIAGKKVRSSDVCILSEERKSFWLKRREELDISTKVWLFCRPLRQKLKYDDWVKLLKEVTDFLLKENVGLLVIDTISSFWSVDNENDAARVQAALIPLNYLLENNVGVLLVHHFRKSGGEQGTAARGSGVLSSYADIIVEFSRMEGNPKDTQRLLKGYSRFEETPVEVVINLVNGSYETLGTRKEVVKERKFKNVLKIIEELHNRATSNDIHEHWDDEKFGRRPAIRTIQRYLKEMVEIGSIKQVGKRLMGKRKVSIYAKKSNDTTATSPIETSIMGEKDNIIGKVAEVEPTGLDEGYSKLAKEWNSIKMVDE